MMNNRIHKLAGLIVSTYNLFENDDIVIIVEYHLMFYDRIVHPIVSFIVKLKK